MCKKKKVIEVDPEYGVDSRYTSEQERIEHGKLLMEGRLERMKNLTEEQIELARRMQQRFKNER